jgi:hypothetical protein
MTLRTRALFLCGLAAAVSCSDAGGPLTPIDRDGPGTVPRGVVQALECTVEVAARRMSCVAPQPRSGSALGSEQITIGGQNLYVTLAATRITVAEDTIQLDVTVQNLIPQALGVDGVGDPHADGVRVFFSTGPIERPSNSGATLLNADGTALFFVGQRPYFQYDTVLATGATSGARPWQIQFTPGSTSVYFTVYVAAHVRYPKGWIDISPDSVLMEVDSVRELTAVVRDFVGRDINETITWTSSAPGVASVAALTSSTAEVTGEAQGTAWIRAVSNAEPVRRDSILVTVDNVPTLVVDSIGALSNVTVPVDSANGMLANDSDDGLLRVIVDSVGTARGGSAWLNEDGSFEYLSPAGFAGRDSIHYQVSDGVRILPGLAVVDVDASRYWYVRAGGTGDGRDRAPLGSVAAAVDSAAAGDTIFVLSAGATQLDGTWTLENGQAIVGQGIASDFQVGPYNGAMVTVLEAGISPWLTSGGATVTLASNHRITGVSITSTAGSAVTGSGFGDLVLRRTVLSPTGPALLLSTGTVDVDATVTVSSSGSAGTGFSLTAVDGTFAPGAGSIGGAAGAAVHVSGGDVEVTYAGDITNSAGRSVHVTGRTGGGVTLSGSITDTGAGILVTGNTGGTVSFTGASKSFSTGTNTALALTDNAGAAVVVSGGGLDVGTTTGAALVASGGTLTIIGTGNALTTTTGGAMSLNGVEVGSGGIAFATVNTGAAAAPVSLVDVTSTGAITVAGGTIAGGPGARFAVSGGDVNVNWAGALQQWGNAAPLVSVAGSHAGSLTFSGNMSATSGDGLQFSAANGTYVFSGATELNGGDAGVDITNGSAGSFTFGTGTSITSPTGTAFNVYGSSPVVTYSGNITKAHAGAIVEVGEQPGGSVTFQTGTLLASAGSGVSLYNADGTVAFNGTTTLSGGPSIAIGGGSAGTISFASGASVTNPASAGLLVSASAPALTYAGTISSSAARPVQIEGMTGGTVAVSGSVTGTGNGILVQNNNTGSAKVITFSGAVNLNTGANEAVTLASNTGATIGFTGGATDLTTTTGNAFAATGGGTVNVSGGSNDISTSTGSALLLNGVTLGASGISLATLNVTGAAVAPVVLTNVGVTTESGITVSGGSIAAGAGTRLAVSGGTVNASWAGSISQSTHTASLLSVAGGHASGTLAFSGTLSATSGNGLQFNNAGGTYSFTGTTTLNGGDAGVDITNLSSGTFSFGSGTSISNPTGTAFDVNGGSPSITYAGTITQNNARAVSLASMGGSATFSGNITGSGASATGISVTGSSASVTFSGASKSLSTQGNAAVTLTNNSGSILFSGGGLAITTSSGAGLNASGGGGTLQVTGANNTIVSGTGIALNVQNVNIGASGLTFVSIQSTGGTNAIVLNNTGSTNGLLVTGTGTAGSGGTISGATANQISLTSARNVSLSHMIIQNGGESGIYGSNLTNFRLKHSTVSGNGNAVGEAGLEFENLLGTDSIVNTVVTGSSDDNLVVRNTSGTLDSLVVIGSTFSSNSSIGNDGILVTASNTANVTVRVRGNTFTANRGDHFQATASNSAVLNVVLSGNSMTGGHASALGQGITLGNGLTHTGTFTYDIDNNQIPSGPISNAVTVNHAGTTGSVMQGRIRNNTIGTSGANLSCSASGHGIAVGAANRGTHTVSITGNTVRRCYDRGIELNLVDGAPVTVNATITGNTVNELTTTFARQALYVNVGGFDPNFLGVRDNFTVCADIQSNDLTPNPGYSTEAIRLRMRFDSRMNLPGYTGPFDNAGGQVDTYLAARNTLTGSAAATTTATSSTYGYHNAGASCPTPP